MAPEGALGEAHTPWRAPSRGLPGRGRVTLVANARMYAVAPEAARAWQALFTWVARASGVPLKVLDHPFPAPLSDLWTRPDLGCVFMCGWPLARLVADVVPVAAPIPAAGRAEGRPVYWTDLVVRADSPFRSLEDTFGARIAYTVEDSQSGFNALRKLLLPYRRMAGPPLYREAVGPTFTPLRALEAVVGARADAAPLDSYALALLRRYRSALAGQVRSVAQTEPTPIPPLVAHASVDRGTIARWREALIGAAQDADGRALLSALGLQGFAAVARESYDVTLRWAADAEAAGFTRLP